MKNRRERDEKKQGNQEKGTGEKEEGQSTGYAGRRWGK